MIATEINSKASYGMPLIMTGLMILQRLVLSIYANSWRIFGRLNIAGVVAVQEL